MTGTSRLCRNHGARRPEMLIGGEHTPSSGRSRQWGRIKGLAAPLLKRMDHEMGQGTGYISLGEADRRTAQPRPLLRGKIRLRLHGFGQGTAAFEFRKLTCKHPRASPPIKLAAEKNTGGNLARLKMRPKVIYVLFFTGRCASLKGADPPPTAAPQLYGLCRTWDRRGRV